MLRSNRLKLGELSFETFESVVNYARDRIRFCKDENIRGGTEFKLTLNLLIVECNDSVAYHDV